MYVHVRVSLYLHAGGRVCVCAKDQRWRDQGSSGCLLLIMAGFFYLFLSLFQQLLRVCVNYRQEVCFGLSQALRDAFLQPHISLILTWFGAVGFALSGSHRIEFNVCH